MPAVDTVFLGQSKDFVAALAVRALQGGEVDNPSPDPVVVVLLFILRCLVPLGIMLGVSYLLRKFGLISEPPKTSLEENNGENEGAEAATEGDLLHGKV